METEIAATGSVAVRVRWASDEAQGGVAPLQRKSATSVLKASTSRVCLPRISRRRHERRSLGHGIVLFECLQRRIDCAPGASRIPLCVVDEEWNRWHELLGKRYVEVEELEHGQLIYGSGEQIRIAL